MREFTISKNAYLSTDINAFYHDGYNGGGAYKIKGTLEYDIFTLKGEISQRTEVDMNNAINSIGRYLLQDLCAIHQCAEKLLTVCVIPRAKVESSYARHQRLFKALIKTVVKRIDGLQNGVDYIKRTTNTYTTHRGSFDGGGDGLKPYPGITLRTCDISDDVKGKDILLIDDIYTGGVNIDEDAIEALLKKGARSVIFYAVGRTVYRRDLLTL